jgi:hypothetical protein
MILEASRSPESCRRRRPLLGNPNRRGGIVTFAETPRSKNICFRDSSSPSLSPDPFPRARPISCNDCPVFQRIRLRSNN